MPRPYAPQAYHHAPAGATFNFHTTMSIETAEFVLRALDVERSRLEELVLEAMDRGRGDIAGRLNNSIQALLCQHEALTDQMNEASAEFVPTGKEHQESLDEDNGRDAA
jgi:hypothetical protein